jgi:C4-dicarboxylate-specific signal transduction histidine kinase
MEPWQEEAARLGGASLAQVLTEMRDGQRRLVEVVESVRLNDVANKAGLADLLSGFPAGDFDGHRRYHEAVIEWRELRNKLVREALIKVAQAGSLAAFGWVALAIWQSFKLTVKQ